MRDLSVLKGPAGYALAILAGGVVIWLLWDKAEKTTKEAATAVGGLVSGNNAITKDTAYEGAGVLGTLGAAANVASGGFFESTGSKLGGWIYDTLHPGDGE